MQYVIVIDDPDDIRFYVGKNTHKHKGLVTRVRSAKRFSNVVQATDYATMLQDTGKLPAEYDILSYKLACAYEREALGQYA